MSSVGPIAYPPELPISARRDDLLAAIRDHQVVVVAGETGSGKTTQLPKLCLELGRERIAHTQPRRLAARTVAQRIADELKVPLGGAVGYAVRFSDRTSAETRIRLVTDGLLLAEIRRDRDLRRYDTIIIDEAHERSLNVDFLLGYVKRLLPRRPELKLIVTSATIDPEQFSRHYGDAPIIEVSGRTYPVEVRYRPVVDPDVPESERDPLEAIGEAVEELQRAGPGDVLVFLSGEREIRDAADHLRGRLPDDVELLPLYARLATGEQQRVFKDHQRRRVVLATNVAETSLTVPGIRYVIDPGTARISRYSARLKVQRLPIERVSQASADQRKGRCGRTSDGICIRLYTEDDYDERPRFTDPEILRTNLASVILQMAALRLGAIEDFPFLDPPDGRQVRDGVLLLQELGALDADQRLTKLGRRLARLPLDPRLGRMVLEADRRGCAHEVVVIAAALSIQDPRERPSERREAADQLHARFADERSDLIGYLNLWRYVHDRQRELSGSAFRRLCRDEHLHFLRIREWQDLVGQLRTAARELDVTMNRALAEPDDVHVALLAGLLSHLGMRDAARREYQGARGARFAIFPGSSVAKAQPNWVMAAELVETSRLWGREVARIEPAWVEPLAEHLARRTYSEPRWDRRRGSVVATERVTVYGLPIVAGRTVAYGRIDPVLSRELFIGCALVERDWDTRHAFFAENGRLLEEIDALEQRERRRDLLVGDDALFAFFDARVPDDIVSGAHFDRWWRDARRTTPELLTYTRELLIAPAAASVDGRGRPESWCQGDVELALSYRFEPGSEEDGVTVHVPLKTLPQLREQGFDWLVPAFREELVTALIRSLPKELRRPLVPVPEVAAEVVAALKPRRGRFPDAVARELERLRGVRVPRTAWDLERLPAHLRVTFRVEDDDGELVAEGKDLAALRAEVRPRLRAELSAAAAGLERTGLREWSLGDLPRVVALPGTGQAVRGYPALLDEGETVAVRVLDSESAQQAAMRTGTRRLLALTVPSPARAVTDRLSNAARLALATAPHGTLAAALDDAVAAATDALVARAGGPAWDAAGFARLRSHVVGELADATADVLARVVEILDAAAEVRRRLQALPPAAPAEAREDVARQVGRLVYPGFVTATGAERLPDVVRYLRGAERRLERLPAKPAADLDRMRTIHELEGLYRERRDRAPGDMPWLLEELRVSQFAQGLGTRQPVSVKRLRRLLDEAG